MIEEVTGLIDDFLLILVLIRNDDFKGFFSDFLVYLILPCSQVPVLRPAVPDCQTAHACRIHCPDQYAHP